MQQHLFHITYSDHNFSHYHKSVQNMYRYCIFYIWPKQQFLNLICWSWDVILARKAVGDMHVFFKNATSLSGFMTLSPHSRRAYLENMVEKIMWELG